MIDISKVNVGDRVRITGENGDEATFTVVRITGRYLESETVVFDTRGQATIEIIEPTFKPVPGLYSHQKTGARVALLLDGRAYYVHSSGAWIAASIHDGDVRGATREKGSWKREITF